MKFQAHQYYRLALLILFINLNYINSQQQFVHGTEQQKQQIRQRQYSNRDANRMNYQNVQSYTIKLSGVDSFFLTPQVDQQVKCQIYIYWKQANIFISSEYRPGEEIRTLVYEDDRRIIFDRSFYMVDGFSFQVKKNSTYEIRFIKSGRIQKLLSLTLNKMLQPSKQLPEKNDLIIKQQKIGKIKGQVQAFFSISQRNFIIEQKLTHEVLSSTKLYMGYQILEILIVLIITVMQTIFVSKILTSSSII